MTTVGNIDGTPRYGDCRALLGLEFYRRFTGLKDKNDYTYEYNPCYPFQYGSSGCKSDTAVSASSL